MSATKQGASWKQWLHFFTGDRKKEADALTKSTLGDRPDHDGRVEETAADLVRAAHGDKGVDETAKVEGDIATPADVVSQAASPSQVADSEKRRATLTG